MKNSILIIEDDLNLGFLLVDFLEDKLFKVKLCREGDKALEAFANSDFDLCVIDVMLPKIDGFTLASKFRDLKPDIPLIFLTARNQKEDKLKGFGLGADDYVTKPFDEDELLCRINAVLNRSGNCNVDAVYAIGSYEFDTSNLSLVCGKNKYRLTVRENEVLKHLCRRKNKVVKKEDLLLSIWGDDSYFNGRSLDVFISKLRKHLQHDSTVSIENIQGAGLILKDA